MSTTDLMHGTDLHVDTVSTNRGDQIQLLLGSYNHVLDNAVILKQGPLPPLIQSCTLHE